MCFAQTENTNGQTFTFSPAIIDSLIDYTQLFTVPSLTFRIITRKKIIYTKILQEDNKKK